MTLRDYSKAQSLVLALAKGCLLRRMDSLDQEVTKYQFRLGMYQHTVCHKERKNINMFDEWKS